MEFLLSAFIVTFASLRTPRESKAVTRASGLLDTIGACLLSWRPCRGSSVGRAQP